MRIRSINDMEMTIITAIYGNAANHRKQNSYQKPVSSLTLNQITLIINNGKQMPASVFASFSSAVPAGPCSCGPATRPKNLGFRVWVTRFRV